MNSKPCHIYVDVSSTMLFTYTFPYSRRMLDEASRVPCNCMYLFVPYTKARELEYITTLICLLTLPTIVGSSQVFGRRGVAPVIPGSHLHYALQNVHLYKVSVIVHHSNHINYKGRNSYAVAGNLGIVDKHSLLCFGLLGKV